MDEKTWDAEILELEDHGKKEKSREEIEEEKGEDQVRLRSDVQKIRDTANR